MTFMTGLQCHLCGAKYPAEALWVCGECLGPLEVVYDYDGVREAMTRDVSRAGRGTSGASASCCRSSVSRGPDFTPVARRS